MNLADSARISAYLDSDIYQLVTEPFCLLVFSLFVELIIAASVALAAKFVQHPSKYSLNGPA